MSSTKASYKETVEWLMRLKAKWQAEAIEGYAKRLADDNDDPTEQVCIEDVHDALLSEANRLRRQSEEPS